MIDHTPLDPAGLSTAAQRALGPGPGRAMAARGLLPLTPADQAAVLYQLAIDADDMIAGSARATAAGLPDKLLAGTLADPTLDPRILDYFGGLVVDKPAAFDAVVRNPSVADATAAALAGRGGAREVDVIAQNEQRLLRHPEIIAAMYMNRHARMSTIDRVIELAVRNHVRVPGLAAWDEVARAITGAPAPDAPPAGAGREDDALFAIATDSLSGDDSQLTAGDAGAVLEGLGEGEGGEGGAAAEDTPARAVPIDKMSVPARIRLATLGNAFARSMLIRDPVRLVALAAIKSPGVTEIEALRYAGSQTLSEDVIRYIAQQREWTKVPGIRAALCRNAKTPIADAMRFLPFLREKELANLAKSRGVSSAVVAGARKLIAARHSKK